MGKPPRRVVLKMALNENVIEKSKSAVIPRHGGAGIIKREWLAEVLIANEVIRRNYAVEDFVTGKPIPINPPRRRRIWRKVIAVFF